MKTPAILVLEALTFRGVGLFKSTKVISGNTHGSLVRARVCRKTKESWVIESMQKGRRATMNLIMWVRTVISSYKGGGSRISIIPLCGKKVRHNSGDVGPAQTPTKQV